MTVYIVLYDNSMGVYDFCGVFATKELAERFIEKKKPKCEEQYYEVLETVVEE